MRRVVITGIGVISSIGTGKEDFMEGILSGKDGKKDIPYFNTEKYTLKRANIVEGFHETQYCMKNGNTEKEAANVYAYMPANRQWKMQDLSVLPMPMTEKE